MAIQKGTNIRHARIRAGGDCRIRISQEIEDPEWDAFLAETPGGHHVQTSLWGQSKALLNWNVTRVMAIRGGRIVGGAQLLTRTLPFVGRLGAFGYVTKGPLFAVDDPSLLEPVIDALHRVAGANRVQYMVVQPPDNGEAVAHRLPEMGFRYSPIEVTPTATLLIDLSAEPDDIMHQMRETTRRNIRRGQKKGIVVREGAERDLPIFHHLLTSTAHRQDFSPYDEEYFDNMWRILRPHGYICLLIAEYEGEPVSAHLLVPFRDTVIVKKVGWSGLHGDLRPNDVLYWESIMWARANGYRYCDLEGIELKAARVLLRGEHLPDSYRQTPTFFKLGFGGKVTILPGSYDYVYNPLLRWPYNTVLSRVIRLPGVWGILERFAAQ